MSNAVPKSIHKYFGFFNKSLNSAKRFCKDKNITLLFAISADNKKLSSKLETDLMYPIVSKVFKALQNKNINNILLLDESFRHYSGKEKQYLWVRPRDSHYSVLAHKLAGKGLFDYVIGNKLIIDSFSPKINKTP